MVRMQRLVVVAACAVLAGACAGASGNVRVASVGVPMADGVRLAADVMVPKGAERERVPAVLIQTRYWRSFSMRVPDPPGQALPGPRDEAPAALLEAGYAVVVVDVRGTGASEGVWPHPWSTAEVADMATLLDFVAAQPWSNGTVGTYGVSYEGTTALLAATHGHRALKAVLARQVEWDLLDELLAPGGVRNVSFPKQWHASVVALDHNDYPPLFPRNVRWLIRGVHPLDAPWSNAALDTLVARRRVPTVERDVALIRGPDDRFGEGGPPVRQVGPSGHWEALARTTAAVGVWGSWWDGATADAVLRASAAMPLSEAVVGAWDHEATRNNSAFSTDRDRGLPDMKDVVAFFDRHLRGRGPERPSRRWFVAGAEAWEAGAQWPATGEHTLNLSDGGLLTAGTAGPSPAGLSPVTMDVDFGATSGTSNRWVAGLLVPVDYAGRRHPRGAPAFTGAPLERPVELWGSSTLTCGVQLDGPDAALHVTVEALVDGRARYLTEGVQRVTGGVAQVRLRPVAVRLPAGARLRMTLAGADAGTFERVPAVGPRRITLTDADSARCAWSFPQRL